MLVRNILAAGVIMIAGANPAAAQSGLAFDPNAGVFRPIPAMPAASSVASVAPRAGRYEMQIPISVKTPLAAGVKPVCTLTASHFTPRGVTYQETATVTATGSGAAWTCMVVIPYTWYEAETTSPVNLSVMVSAGNYELNSRSHFRTLPPSPLPVNNAITKLIQRVTI